MLTQNSKKFVLISMSICLSLIFLDQTAIPIALPIIQMELHSTLPQLEWVLNSYILVIASLIIVGGKLADLLGNRRVFYFGCLAFTFGSFLGGVSVSVNSLIIGRIIQGLGAAFMMPSSGVLLFNAFDHEERGKIMGIYIAFASIFLALGPMIGGFITHYWGWQWMFFINVPFILLSVITLLSSNIKESQKNIQLKQVDFLGFLLLILTLVPLVFVLMQENVVLSNTFSRVLIGSSIIAFSFFLYIERKKQYPLINILLFKNLSYRVSIAIIVITQISIIAISFWPILIENIFNLNTQQTGYLLLCVMVPVMIVSPLAGKLIDTHGPRLPVGLGLLSLAIGSLWIGMSIWLQNYKFLIPGFLIYGCGPSFLLASIMTYAMNTCPSDQRGEVAGMTSFFRQLGGTIGLTMFSALINNSGQMRLLFGSIDNNSLQSNIFVFSLLAFFTLVLVISAGFLLKYLPNNAEIYHSEPNLS